MNEKIVEYILKKGNVELEAYIDINTIDDDEPEGGYRLIPYVCDYQTRIPANPYNEFSQEYIDYEKIVEVDHVDWDEISQWLWDFQDETRTVERNGYDLIINPEN